jgi:serine protease Do
MRGDVIVAINGTPTNTSAQLRNQIALAGKGTRVRVEIERAGKPRMLEVVLGELPSDRGGGAQKLATGLLGGITVQPLDRANRNRLRIPDDVTGVLVTEVQPDSAAAEFGLRPDDVIVEVNRNPTPDLDTFRKATHASDESVLLLVYRDGTTVFMSLTR